MSHGHRAALFSSRSVEWPTPAALYQELQAEFHFDLDPCPVGALWDGRLVSWVGRRVFCNPPYGRQLSSWLDKATEAELAVYLVPARTDTRWWHVHAMRADEIRFLRGRLNYGDRHSRKRAPFPSVILVYLQGREGIPF